MANTILEKLQEKYPNATGINDARNIAEAVACINGTGGRGANAIADHIWPLYTLTYNANGGSGTIDPVIAAPVVEITLNDGSDLTPPSNKVFSGWGTTDAATENVPANWAQNRVMLSLSDDAVLTEVTSTEFANSGIIETTKDLTIEVAQGYTIFGWATEYNELGHGGRKIVNAWSSGKITYTYDSAYPYLVLCLQKSPSAVITATEAADAVKIYSENETIAVEGPIKINEDTTLYAIWADAE